MVRSPLMQINFFCKEYNFFVQSGRTYGKFFSPYKKALWRRKVLLRNDGNIIEATAFLLFGKFPTTPGHHKSLLANF